MPRRKKTTEAAEVAEETKSKEEQNDAPAAVVKKKRGRPPKNSAVATAKAEVKESKTKPKKTSAAAKTAAPKRKKTTAKQTVSKTEKVKTAAKSKVLSKSGKKNGVADADVKKDAKTTVAAERANDADKAEAAGKYIQPQYAFADLAKKSVSELYNLAEQFNVKDYDKLRYDDLLLAILKNQAESMGYGFGGGTLEIKSSDNGIGFGFLRPAGFLPSSEDIYVSASQIRRFCLRNGDVVWGVTRPPREGEQFGAILRIENINYTDPELSRQRPVFEKLTPIFPNEKLNLETEPRKIAARIVDLFAPIGKGQRALLVAPPKAGKTTLLKNIANAITTNHPEVILMVLLIDERPEEVTDMSRSVNGEIIASTFDRPAEEHIRVATLALDKAKRLAEVGKDVVVLLDSITRLARASNLVAQPSGRTLSGGMDPAALYFPKKFFGAARNIENGGSFTIIGTTLVETGSRMDDVIYEEFKGTGNMEVQLSRKIAEQRIFPALDITKSSTRRDDLLIPKEDLDRINMLRRKIANMDEAEVLNMIIERLRMSKTNKEFLSTIRVS